MRGDSPPNRFLGDVGAVLPCQPKVIVLEGGRRAGLVEFNVKVCCIIIFKQQEMNHFLNVLHKLLYNCIVNVY